MGREIMKYKIFDAPFHGANLDTLVRPSTLCEYRADVVDSSMGLLDCSGSNLCPYSEDFTNWSALNGSAVGNSHYAPNGILAADTLKENATPATVHYFYPDSISFTSGNKYKWSVWIRPINRSQSRLVVAHSSSIPSSYFTLAGAGSISGETNCTASIKYVGNSWYLCSIEWTAPATESVQPRVQIAESGSYVFDGLNQDSLAAWGSHLRQIGTSITKLRENQYIYTTSVVKPRLDMTATGSPVAVPSRIQGPNGNLLQAMRYDGTSDYHSVSHHDCMNVFDEDHTITVLCTTDDTADSEFVLCHGAWNSYGFYIYNVAVFDSYVVRYNKLGAGVTVGKVTALTTGQYALIQIVRSSNIATMYINGTSQGSADVTGYGIAGSRNLSIAEINAFTGDVAYVRIDREASSAAKLAEERALLLGYGIGIKGGRNPW